jgi:chromosome segregation ATPase
MNPSAFENEAQSNQFNFERVNEEQALNEQEKDRIFEQAELFKNSSILKSYELLIQKYEQEFDVKNSQLKDFERQI